MQDMQHRFFSAIDVNNEKQLILNLSVRDFIAAKLTCKRWYNAANDLINRLDSDKFLAWLFHLTLDDTHDLLDKCMFFTNRVFYRGDQQFDAAHYANFIKNLIIGRNIPLLRLVNLQQQLIPHPTPSKQVRRFTRINMPCLAGLSMPQLSACVLCFTLYQVGHANRDDMLLSDREESWRSEIEKWANDAIADNGECVRISRVYLEVKSELSGLLDPEEAVEEANPVTPTQSLNWSQ